MNTQSLLDAIRVVKENERKAADFYAEAATKTANPVGRELFEQLSQFEEYHFARLTALEKTLEADGKFINYEGREFPQPPEVVPKPVEETEHLSVMNIITRALELEKQAEQAYADIADQVTDPQGHAMFRRLSGEEHKHYQLLKEAYWNLTNFRQWKWS
jgi:rubrerythrin